MLAVVDTNVIVSALITRNQESPTLKVLDYVFSGEIIPLFEDEILAEYQEVLSRPKFNIPTEKVDYIVGFIRDHGLRCSRLAYLSTLPDEKDRVFYEISLSVDQSYLVTGNLKHYPSTPKIVTPAEIIQIINETITQ